MLFEQAHCPDDLLVRALAAASIGCFLEAFHADGGDEVLHAQQILAKLFVYERRVGEREERAVGVRFAERDEIPLAHERLAARVDVHVGAELGALADNGVQFVVGEVFLVTVLGGPTTGAVQVAGARRIHEDGPGHVAAVLLAHGLLLWPCHEVAVNEERLDEVVAHHGIQLEHACDELVPIALLVDSVAEGGPLTGEQVGRCYLVQHIHDLGGVALGVFQEIIERLLEGRVLDLIGCLHRFLL